MADHCTNTNCNIRIMCERSKLPKDAAYRLICFNDGFEEGLFCREFVIRSELLGADGTNKTLPSFGDPSSGRRRRGIRHNAHAPESERLKHIRKMSKQKKALRHPMITGIKASSIIIDEAAEFMDDMHKHAQDKEKK